MNAAGDMARLVDLASQVLHLGYFIRMKKIFDGGVAVGATQNAVPLAAMLARVNRNAFALGGDPSRLALAGEAGFVLLERMGRLRLGPGPPWNERA